MVVFTVSPANLLMQSRDEMERLCQWKTAISGDEQHKNCIYVFLLFLLSAALMSKQLMVPGYYSVITNDTITYTRWARDFAEALKEGVAYPRWMANDFWGYGSPAFISYSPLSFYLAAVLFQFTGSMAEAMSIAKFLAYFLAGTGLFFLAAEFYPKRIAFLAAAGYLLYPFNLLQIYLFGSFAAVVSLGWYCPILLSISRYYSRREFRHLMHAGLCYGGLCLTYLINAYILAFVMASFIVIKSVRSRRFIDLLPFPAVVMTGCLLAAAYLLPLLAERSLLHVDSFISGPGHSYSKFFLLPKLTDLLPTWMFWRVYYDLFASHTWALMVVLVSLSLKAVRFGGLNPDVTDVNRTSICLAAFSIFMSFGVSGFVWETVPFFKFIQFPVRWLHIAVLAASLLAASFLHTAEKRFSSCKTYHSRVILIFLILISMDAIYIKKAHRFAEQELLRDTSQVWPQEHLPIGIEMSTLRREATAGGKADVIEGVGTAETVSWKSTERVARVAAGKPVVVRVGTLYFPGWKAYLDDKEAEITPAKGSSAMLVRVPAGMHRLKLTFTDTPARFYGKVISLISLLFLAALLLIDTVKNRRNQRADAGDA
jgi:hypothetical protein